MPIINDIIDYKTKTKPIFFCVCFAWGALPHRFIREFDFRPLKFKLLPFATDIRDNVRPRSPVGSVKTAQSYCENGRKIIKKNNQIYPRK